MKKIIYVMIAAMALFSVFARAYAGDVAEYYVSPDGNDAWSGTAAAAVAGEGPFATLERARDELRMLRQRGVMPDGGAVVYLRGGIYLRDRTFELAERDGGTEGAPVVYRAYRDETPRLVGGVRLEPGWFEPVSDDAVAGRLTEKARGRVVRVDLPAHGISDYGELVSRGFTRPELPAAMELFFEGRAMPLARWPNKRWLKIAAVPNGKEGDSITYVGDAPKRWAEADDIWMHGYWTFDWADSYVKIKSMNKERREIVTSEPYGAYGYTSGRRFRFINVFEELDSPGEWYLDRGRGLLYFLPPKPMDGAEIFVSLIEVPLLSIRGASDVRIEGLVFEAARGSGVVVAGGARNLVAGCTVRNLGNTAITVEGGTGNGVTSCDIYGVDTGIRLSGGDRAAIEPAGNFATNNHIHHFSRWARTYTPAIKLRGVGNRVANNYIHDAPHTALLFGGNEHVIELNELHDISWETNDVGVIYIGRNWTERGHVIRYNYIHNIQGMHGQGVNMTGTSANSIYLDDMASGVTVYGNIFYRASVCMFIGGGRDNVVENNVFIDCSPALHLDGRGIGWAKDSVKEGGVMWKRLMDMNYTQPPYSERYPELIGLLDDEPGLPKGNLVARNIVYNSNWLHLNDVNADILDMEDNLLDADPMFEDIAAKDFRLKEESPAWAIGFSEIPIEKIGLYIDEYRHELPGRE